MKSSDDKGDRFLMKNQRKQKLIVSVCMIFVVCFVLITATYAWFTESNRASMNQLNLKVDGTGELKVEIAIEPSGTRMEMSKVDENKAIIDMGLGKLANIEENKLGPGAFGEVHIYISTDSTAYDGYTISVTPSYKLVGTSHGDVVKLAREHIKFYGTKTTDGYADEIPYREEDGEMIGLTGTLAEDGETEVILYWYWPYEYADVPDKSSISAKSTREYDLQDTMIGNYLESIGFTFEVEGNLNEK